METFALSVEHPQVLTSRHADWWVRWRPNDTNGGGQSGVVVSGVIYSVPTSGGTDIGGRTVEPPRTYSYIPCPVWVPKHTRRASSKGSTVHCVFEGSGDLAKKACVCFDGPLSPISDSKTRAGCADPWIQSSINRRSHPLSFCPFPTHVDLSQPTGTVSVESTPPDTSSVQLLI